MSIIVRSPLWLLCLPPLLLAGIWLARGTALPRLARGVRLLMLACIVIALADPVRPGTPTAPPLLVLVDQSASLAPEQRAEAWRMAQHIAAQRTGARTTLAAFGAEVALAQQATPPAVADQGTDLRGALAFAAGLQPAGGRVLLISDGGATTPGADALAQQLRTQGVRVDVLPLERGTPPDARVAAITLPPGLRAGQRVRGQVILVSDQPRQATLALSFNATPLGEQSVALEAGRTAINVELSVPREGVHRLRAELRLEDAYPQNNVLETALSVGPPPRVLVVERRPDAAARLRDTLEQQGIQSEALRPADLSSRLSDLARFDAIVLQDVPASALSLDQQRALEAFVRSLGHGLIALGGASSYSLGGYRATPLEEVLPVSMEVPPRRERQQVALLLIVDRSASMHGFDPRTSKIAMAKGAALAATQVLVPDDRIGVLTFDTEPVWTVPFTAIGAGLELAEIQDRIAAIELGGGTDIYRALGIGLPELARQSSAVRHAVLLTDGRSPISDPTAYDRLMQAARDAQITLSTIAIGQDADTELLQRLADLGGGRYHFAADPGDLPQLTMMETEIARDDPRVEGAFQPQPAGAHPIVRGLVPSQLPQLGGYVAVTPKAEAEVVLRSPQDDPILATWQYGLGRAVAWTSDGGEAWGAAWQSWADAPAFWSQVLSYTFPDPGQGPLTVRIDDRGPTPRIVAEARDEDGAPLDLADVGARVRLPDGTEQTLRLLQVAPGRYETPLPATTTGAYQIDVALRKAALRLQTSAGWSRPYPAEYAVAADRALLERIAASSGGQVLSTPEAALRELQAAQPRPTQAFWPWLIGVALALWPLEIAIRRGWLGRRR